MKTDYDVICGFLAREKGAGQRLQSELRPGRPTTDPRSGEPVEGTQTAVLWCEDQPVAALVGSVVLVNRTARYQDHRKAVVEEAQRRGYDVQQVREPDLWRLAT